MNIEKHITKTIKEYLDICNNTKGILNRQYIIDIMFYFVSSHKQTLDYLMKNQKMLITNKNKIIEFSNNKTTKEWFKKNLKNYYDIIVSYEAEYKKN